MVWGGISSHGKVGLVVIRGNMNGQRYRDEVLNAVVVPYINNHPHRIIFQHDNARPHTARATVRLLRENNVEVMQWPALSPDLSPIEHVWDELGRRVRHRDPAPRNLQELENCLLDEWQNLPMAVISRYIHSMRRRCDAVLANHGGHTRY